MRLTITGNNRMQQGEIEVNPAGYITESNRSLKKEENRNMLTVKSMKQNRKANNRKKQE